MNWIGCACRILLVTQIAFISAAAAAPKLRWTQRYAGIPVDAGDSASRVVTDSGGNFFVAGDSGADDEGDVLLLKYSPDGTLLWTRRYDNPDKLSDTTGALAVDTAGNPILAVASTRKESKLDISVTKYSAADGTLLWEHLYNSSTNWNDQPTGLALDAQGNVAVTGITYIGDNYDIYAAKLSASDGAVLWENRYDSAEKGQDYARAVATDSDGNVIITGASNLDFYTAKFSAAAGALLWQKKYSAPTTEDLHDEGYAVAVDSQGNVVVTGVSFLNGYQVYTAKYARADGALIWEARHAGPDFSPSPTPIAIDAQDNVFVATEAIGAFTTIKYDGATGAVLWERVEPRQRNVFNRPEALALTSAGDVVVGGMISSDFVAMYRGTDGSVIWAQKETFGRSGLIHGLVVTPQSDVVITGAGFNTNQVVTTTDFQTARLSGTNGAVIWQKLFNDQSSGPIGPVNLGFDNSSNLVVLAASSYDFYTAKYAAGDGHLLWDRRYDGPSSLRDTPADMKIDSRGNVIVTGSTELWTNGYRATDLYTAKYSGTDGSILWQRSFNGADNLDDGGTLAAVDSQDNVVVCGFERTLNNWNDFYTAKYNGVTGEVLWERRYNGPYNHTDDVRHLVVDTNNDVVVSGTSLSRGSNLLLQNDVYTAKYSGSTGALLWEQRSSSPTSRTDVAAIALDLQQNVVIAGNSPCVYVRKYAAGNGAILWETCSPYTNVLHRSISRMVIDTAGNIFLGGGEPFRNAFQTAVQIVVTKLSPNGSVLWETLYRTPERIVPPFGSVGPSDSVLWQIALDANNDLMVLGGYEKTGEDRELFLATFANSDGGLLSDFHPPEPDFPLLAISPGQFAMAGRPEILGKELITALYDQNLTPRMAVSVSNGDLRISWPAAFRGWVLETRQQNGAILGPWTTVPGSQLTNEFTIPLSTANKLSFYRLSKPL